jgi:hypothetical protein
VAPQTQRDHQLIQFTWRILPGGFRRTGELAQRRPLQHLVSADISWGHAPAAGEAVHQQRQSLHHQLQQRHEPVQINCRMARADQRSGPSDGSTSRAGVSGGELLRVSQGGQHRPIRSAVDGTVNYKAVDERHRHEWSSSC